MDGRLVCPHCGAVVDPEIPAASLLIDSDTEMEKVAADASPASGEGPPEPPFWLTTPGAPDAASAASDSALPEEADADPDQAPAEGLPEALTRLRVEDSVDPLHVHPDHGGRHGHPFPGEYPSEEFLADAPEVENFLSTAEGSTPNAGQPLPPEATAPAGTIEPERSEEPPRSAWPHVLLMSYASAMTLACGWLLWHRGSPARPLESGSPPEAIAEADPGSREQESTRVEPVEPIPPSLIAGLGETLRVGDLELTPTNVEVSSVELERSRVDGETERKPGGEGALKLAIRLRNVSTDAIFAPLDEGFQREPDRRLPDSFLEVEDGRRIYGYRLPVRSEWGIVGQEFSSLRPGEEMEAVVFSEPDADRDLRGELLWRLRLRTSPGQNAVVGVRFPSPNASR